MAVQSDPDHVDASSALPEELWRHPSPERTRMYAFKSKIETKYDVKLETYNELYQWSIHNIAAFWGEVWIFTGVKASEPFRNVLAENAPMYPRPSFFEGARLNFAENLLFPQLDIDENSLAVIAATEIAREQVTWGVLRDRVRRCALAMRHLGVKANDRIAGYVGNHINALVLMLSATSIGAIWTGVSPDTGVHGVLDRLQQIEPIILFADNAIIYNGKVHDVLQKTREVVKNLPTLKAAVVLDAVHSHHIEIDEVELHDSKSWIFDDFIRLGDLEAKFEFVQLNPDHPVYILYSSGTTGKPKCIVHGAVGTLIQHKKEHSLHCSILPGDRLFYFTTCTWMMWHWLVSGLASGATLILYDGSPFRPFTAASPDGSLAMPALVEELGVTHFGTSAKYLSLLEQKGVMPKVMHPMKTLKAMYSTAAPLAPSTFSYIYKAFGPDIHLGSITGGTDIISLFGAPSTLDPVYKGEIQVRGLGMAVQAWDFTGKDITGSSEPGDLVCVKPFPAQPVAFWGVNGETLYKKAYFETFPGVWHHGDFVKINSATGGMLMLGRSDGVLKPAGVRFGSAEIYNILLEYFPDEVEDALCIGRRRQQDVDETVVLFLKMKDRKRFTLDLITRVQTKVRSELSTRHVPGVVDECVEIPVTTNGKKIEVAVKKILCGFDVQTSASVANVECLEWYREWARTH